MRRKKSVQDLDEYNGCPDDENLGMLPLGIGWLDRKHPFQTGQVPALFAARLAAFCVPAFTVCETPQARKCPLCGEAVAGCGSAEIRVLGQEDIYAAPDLIHHYVTVHQYQPPQLFIDAVMKGSAAGSPEHRALINALHY